MHVVFTFSACAVLESKRMVMKLAKIFHFFGKKNECQSVSGELVATEFNMTTKIKF